MSLYGQWKEQAEKQRTQAEYDKYWSAYFEKEKSNYADILENKTSVIQGTFKEAAEKFDMDPVTFTGFIDGINTSLTSQVDIEALTEDSEISLEIDFEKLYYNMLDAKADWLYNLPEWGNILPEERRKEIKKEYNKSKIAVSSKVGRNDPCPCGSGKKYKKCCAG